MKIKLITLILIIVLLVGGGIGAYFLLKDYDVGIIKTTKNDDSVNIQEKNEKLGDVCNVVLNYLKSNDENVKDVRINKVNIYTKEEVLKMTPEDYFESNFDWDNVVYGSIDFDIKFNSIDGWEIIYENENGLKVVKAPNGWEYPIDKDGWAIENSYFFEKKDGKNMELFTCW